LATGQGEDSFGPADFSPDGQAISYATSAPGRGAVAVVTLSDRRVTELTASPRSYPRVLFSPDGRSVFFSHAPTDTAEDASVQVVHFRP
jgi:Tol biopolymer transport system component